MASPIDGPAGSVAWHGQHASRPDAAVSAGAPTSAPIVRHAVGDQEAVIQPAHFAEVVRSIEAGQLDGPFTCSDGSVIPDAFYQMVGNREGLW